MDYVTCRHGHPLCSNTRRAESVSQLHRARAFIFVVLAAVVALCAWVAALPAPAAAAPANDLFFVHLGHIWRWDGATSRVYPFTQPNGNRVGNVAWSVNGNCVAWTESVPGYPGSQRVHVKERVANPTGDWKEHVIDIAWADVAAVSPDGRRVMVSVEGTPSGITTYEVIIQTNEIVATRPGWVWAAWSPTNILIAYNKLTQTAPFGLVGSSFWMYNQITKTDTEIPVPTAGQTEQDYRARAPQWSPTGTSIVFSKRNITEHRDVLASIDMNTLTVTNRLDVTEFGSHDKRWYYTPTGLEWLYVETTPKGGGQPTISELTSGIFGLWPEFLESSFGMNASLPAQSPFTDVPHSSWYYHAVVTMRAKELISGYADDTFRPTEPLLRAQFAKMITTVAKLAVDENMPLPPFSDLGPDDTTTLYPHEYIAAAYNASIVMGTSATTFSPWNNVTRAQAMTMIVRAADKLWPGLLEPVPVKFTGYLAGFQDPTHGAQARKAEWNNLLKGITLAGWDPWAKATRAEVAQMLFNLLEIHGPMQRVRIVS